MSKRVSVVGLGRLGAPLAACFAARGFDVVGVDLDKNKVEAINHGVAPVHEPGLPELLAKGKMRLKATQDLEAAVRETELTFIVVSTPSEPGGGFSLRYVLPVCESIGRALRGETEFHVVVLTSTVMPGSTGGAVRATLEQASGKRCGTDFGLCYSPEFIALGSVIQNFLHPDFVLIGESDARSGAILAETYQEVCENSPRAARMNFVNAELTKLSVNTYVTTKISFANMLARFCEKIPEANVEDVTRALGLDTRIGPKYLKGAISYGGPCFPRDNLALAAFARQIGARADIAQATDQFNRWQIQWLADLVQRHSSPGSTVGILGLTYKPDTDVVEEAAGLLLARELTSRGVPVTAHDPSSNGNTAQAIGEKARIASSARDCIEQASVIVLTTPWPEFQQIPAEVWARPSSPRVVIDCWGLLEHLENETGVRYKRLGNSGGMEWTHAAS
ncbi:MAG TPA: nucleotide sugar dehydrogenase [Candidatus Acidoferrales bacterium]|nr:nucleotide sugar dehydrogenase [Candidatus Acidoferrales bacterium]